MAISDDFDVRREVLPGGAVVLHVSGDLDLATAPRLEEALVDVSGQDVIIDLAGCTFLDSAGIRSLVAAARRLSEAGRGLKVVTADSGIVRLLEITAVDTVIDVHPSLDDAL